MIFSEWQSKKLGDLCLKIGSGVTPRGGDSVYLPKGVSLVRSQNIYDFHFSFEGLVFISAQQAEKMRNVEVYVGDVLLNITGDSVARCCSVPREILPARVNQHVSIIRANKTLINEKFLEYSLLNKRMKESLLSLSSTGGTRNALTKKMIENLQMKVPSLKEQAIIVGIISSLDDKIELNSKINKTLEEMAQAIFKSWFIDFEPFKDGEFVESQLGHIPLGWVIGKVADFFDITIGKTPPRLESKWFSECNDDIKWASISDMGKNGMFLLSTSEYLTNDAIKKFNVVVVPEYQVILSFKLTVGRVSITNEPLTTNEAIAHFKTGKQNLIEYIYLYLKNFNYETLGSTSSIATATNSKVIKEIPIFIPTDNVLAKFASLVNPIFAKIRLNSIENSQLSSLRDSLLPKLMSGEIRVPIQEEA